MRHLNPRLKEWSSTSSFCLLMLLFSTGFSAIPADAHQIKIAPLEIEITDTQVLFQSKLLPVEILPDTESPRARALAGEGLTESECAVIFMYFEDRFHFTEGGRRLKFAGESAAMARTESFAFEHLQVRGAFARSGTPGAIVLEAKELFAEDVFGAYPPLAVGHIRGPGYFQIHAFDGFAPFIPPEERGWKDSLHRVMAWTVEGIWHIFTGYDHILFLLGLHLVSPSLRETLKIVTAFTVSHTLTLTLAATNTVSLSPSIVEPLIALTIVYVGIENLVFQHPTGRWKTALLFGFIHGFGFAGALGASLHIDLLSRGAFAAALLCFNLGVEIGQAVVVTAMAPFWVGVRWIPRRRLVVQIGSIAISCAGAYWFFQRI